MQPQFSFSVACEKKSEENGCLESEGNEELILGPRFIIKIKTAFFLLRFDLFRCLNQ